MAVVVVRGDMSCPVHADGLRELLDEYASIPMIGGRPLPEDVRRVLPDRLAAQPCCHILLAVDAEQVVGAAVCFLGFSTFAGRPLLNIHDLAVRASVRGQGIGSRLMDGVEQLARELDCCRVTLEVVPENAGAIALYERQGFQHVQQFWKKDLRDA